VRETILLMELTMFAVIKTGGKQYRVAANDVIVVEKLAGDAGSEVTFSDVLLVAHDGGVKVGAPTVAGASVVGAIVDQRKGDKVKVFKKKRRNTYRRKRGHRQFESVIQITAITADGKTVKGELGAKPAPKTATKDDLKDIGGVGPALEKKLKAEGITSLKQIAAMDAAQIEALSEKIGQGDRAIREEWVEQAKELLAGKPPRAKSDREAKAAREGDAE
jgi:large subunit ribosomal protein L21